MLAGLALLWAALIAGRQVWIQVVRHEHYRKLAGQQQKRLIELRAPRGAIFDRNGQPMAMSLPVDSVCVNTLRAPELPLAVDILAPILKLDREELLDKLRAAAGNRKRRGFVWIKRRISLEESDRLRSLKLDWIEFRQESQRIYPHGSIGAHVVGDVNHAEHGTSGVELSLDADLRGRSGSASVLTDVRQRGISSQVSAEVLAGVDLTLTIDHRIQFIAERELQRAVEENGCVTGSLAVMIPQTGEILALASYPGFDPTEPLRPGEDLSSRLNQAVSVPFEPGSVFKVVTVTAALETTSLKPETIIPCGSGHINLFGRVIRDHHSYSALPMADVLAKSSNIGAINVGLRVGEAKLLDYVRRFGFGRPTGVPLPAESSGVVRDLRFWGKSSIGSVAIGHEISSTTLQLARASAVIANGGMLVEPRLILKRARSGQPPEAVRVAQARRVIGPETAIVMRRLMEGVVLTGTGKLARLQGYSSGGKTGSAQIFDLATKRYTHRYNASFMGFAPVGNPAIVVAVTLNGASKFGGAVAAPVFREVATAALRLLDVPRDLPDTPPMREDEPVDFADSAIADLGSPIPSLPNLGTPASSGPLEMWGPKVPDFYGKTMRVAMEESSASGVSVELVGSGIVRAQSPAAGSILPRGERVRLQFAR